MSNRSSQDNLSTVGGEEQIMMPPSMPPSPMTREQWQKKVDSMQQQNRVQKIEVETFKIRVKSLQEENKALRQASVNIQVKAEQEEEYISNTLLKKIQALKKEKETLALNYEQEEECLTNDLSRKLIQLRQEKVELEQTLEQEQECLVNKLMRKIEKLETETVSKQTALETLRREKIELENTLEQEQESFVNKLWKKMDKLEAEKRLLQSKLEQPISNPSSPAEFNQGDRADNLTVHIRHLRNEVVRLRDQLSCSQEEYNRNTQHYVQEERLIKEENVRLQRKLQIEVERREALCRHLSESESSLEMEDERHFNEMASHRHRTLSSPVSYPSPTSSRPLSPGLREWLCSTGRCPTCGQPPPSSCGMASRQSIEMVSASPPPPSSSAAFQRQLNRMSQERFAKPTAPSASSLGNSPYQSLSPIGQPHIAPKPMSPSPKSPMGPPSPMDISKN